MTATAANAQDFDQPHRLVGDDDEVGYDDAGYQGLPHAPRSLP